MGYITFSPRHYVEHFSNIIRRNVWQKPLQPPQAHKRYYVDWRFLMLFITAADNDSNLLIVFYVQIMPDDFVMQLHRF